MCASQLIYRVATKNFSANRLVSCALLYVSPFSRPRAPSFALLAIHLVPRGGTKNLLMKFNEKAISLACPIGEGAERSEAEGESKSIAIDISQPFRLLAKLAATFPFREDIMIY